MAWWDRWLGALFPRRTGIEVDEPDPLELAVPDRPGRLVRALAELAGPDAELYWEGAADRVLAAWLRRESGAEKPGISVGLTPVSDFHHLPGTGSVLNELGERLERARSLPDRVRLHLHEGGVIVFEWPRAFRAGPLFVSRRIPADRLARFLEAAGAWPVEPRVR